MNAQKPALLDRAFEFLDGPRSPQDFTIILHFDKRLDAGRLLAGAMSARERYGREISFETRIDIEPFVNERFSRYPIKQMLNGATLATRFHHAAADGLSAALWLTHQLSVAYGRQPPPDSVELSLRRTETSVRRSKFAYDGACDQLWTPYAARTGNRAWTTFSFSATELQQACRRAGGFTYSDLLATCVLEVFAQWNCQHNGNGAPQVGLWLPMNIRSRSFEGFGNGTSRIRLYARYSPSASIVDKARAVREQVSWTTEHGEWAVPELPLFTRLPRWIIAPALRHYLNRPSVDMATGVFSHADRWGGASEAFKHVDRIECVGLLHPRQNLAINGASHHGKTWLTFTYDTGLLRTSDVDELVGMYKEQIRLATAQIEVHTSLEQNRSGRGQAERAPAKRACSPSSGGALRLPLPDLFFRRLRRLARRVVMTGLINDALRFMIANAVRMLGVVLSFLQTVRTRRFAANQRRLKQKYRIHSDTPVLSYGPRVVESIRHAATRAGRDARFAMTSGSTGEPKKILYTKRRLRTLKFTFSDMFARACCVYALKRTSLYVFSSFQRDASLTSLLLSEPKRLPYLSTLQAPYRVQQQAGIGALASEYGAAAVRLWILTIANPGVLYATNPSTISNFFDELQTNWATCSQLVRDWHNEPHRFDAAVRNVARRLDSRGSAARVHRVATSPAPLPLDQLAPAVRAYICWTGGYVKPFLDRLAGHLPPSRYRLIPMYSMSTETLETEFAFRNGEGHFLPLAGGVLYEFLDERTDKLLSPDQLKPGETYAMVVSDSYGLRRYLTGDLFECRCKVNGLPDLAFLRRRALEYSFIGEKVTAEQLNAVFNQLRTRHHEALRDAFLTFLPSLPPNENPHYKLVLIGHARSESGNNLPGDLLARQCDELLSELNCEYRNKRAGGLLAPARFTHATASDFAATFADSWETQFKFLPLYRRTWESLMSLI